MPIAHRIRQPRGAKSRHVEHKLVALCYARLIDCGHQLIWVNPLKPVNLTGVGCCYEEVPWSNRQEPKCIGSIGST